MIPRSTLLPLALGPILALCSPALAASASWAQAPGLSVGGQVFSNFHVPTSSFETEGFDITRARIFASGVFDQTWSGHVVLNVKGLGFLEPGGKAASLAHVGMLKMAYIQADDLYPSSQVRLGMIITPWFDYEASAWGYRMLGFLPSAGGFTTSPGPELVPFYDNGLSLKGDEDLFGLKKFVGYEIAAINGEGNTALETDGQLDYEGRLTLRPLADLDLTGMVHRGNPGGAAPSFERYAGLAVYRGGWGRVAFEGNWSHDDGTGGIGSGQILGGWAILNLPFVPLPAQIVLRADRIDGGPGTGGTIDLSPSDGFRYETIAGIAVKPVKNITLMLDNENANWHHPDGSTYLNTDQVALHTQLSF